MDKTQREKDIEYHEVFMRQLKFYLCNLDFPLEKSVFRAHEETWQELAMMNQQTEQDIQEDIHNYVLSDKCLIDESSDEEDDSHSEREWLRDRLIKEQVKNDKLGIENDRLKKENKSLLEFKNQEEENRKFFNLEHDPYVNANNILGQFICLCDEVPDIKEKGVTFAPTDFEV